MRPARNAFSLAGLRREGLGRRSRAFGLRPEDLVIIMPATGRKNALLGRIRVSAALARSNHRPKRLVAYDFASSGPQPGAWMICPPTRRNDRTATLGSCAERRFQDRRPLISEARASKHTPRSPSSSAYIHYEPENLSPPPRPCSSQHDRRILNASCLAATLPQMSSSGLSRGPIAQLTP